MLYLCIMPIQKILQDADFGQIVISTRRGMRQVVMRIKSDGLYVNAPYFTRVSSVLEIVEKHRADLLKKKASRPSHLIDTDFEFHSDFISLRVVEGVGRRFESRLDHATGERCIACPKETDFENPDIQAFLRKAIVNILKRRAAEVLPARLAELAARNGLKYASIRINSAKTRWGSCSSLKTISLSCYIMLLPKHLADYVMLHELSHLLEMNHSERFWLVMDKMTDGRAKQLEKEIKQYHTSF